MPTHGLLSVSMLKRPWTILTLPTCHVLISVYRHKRPFAFLTFPTCNGLISTLYIQTYRNRCHSDSQHIIATSLYWNEIIWAILNMSWSRICI